MGFRQLVTALMTGLNPDTGVTGTNVTGTKRALDGYIRNPTSNPVSTQDFSLEIAKGNVPGHSVVFISGENSTLSSTAQTVWPVGGTYTRRFTTATLNISSGSANDTLLGTGAQQVLITGVSTAYVEVSETLDLNGQTGVATANDYIGINSMVVISAGALGFNDARLYMSTGALTAGVPTVANTYHVMEVNDALSRSAVHTVPAGFCYILVGVTNTTDANKDAKANLRLVSSTGLDIAGFPFNVTNVISAPDFFGKPIIMEKTIIEHQATDVEASALNSTHTFIKVANTLTNVSTTEVP